MSFVNMEKTPKTWGSRLSFLRTKRAIAGLSLLVTVAIILIALGATHNLGNNSSSESKQSQSNSVGTSSSTATATGQGTSIPTSTSTSQYAGSIADGTALRVMCLGASIVKGETSPGTVGFRKVLRDDLVGFGVDVNMVGSVQLGNMTDNDLEAYGGNRITQIHDHAKAIVPKTLPNVFVIQVGTNNILQNLDIDKAGEQMKDFIDYLVETAPRSFVILSTILTNTVGGGSLEPSVLDINQQYRDLMPTFEAEGTPVVLAELHPSNGGDDVPQVADIGPDGSHPLVSGYEKMGHILAQAVKDADAKDYIQVATDNGIPDDGDAEKAGSSRKRRHWH